MADPSEVIVAVISEHASEKITPMEKNILNTKSLNGTASRSIQVLIRTNLAGFQ